MTEICYLFMRGRNLFPAPRRTSTDTKPISVIWGKRDRYTKKRYKMSPQAHVLQAWFPAGDAVEK
jgi:hypothetical protein